MVPTHLQYGIVSFTIQLNQWHDIDDSCTVAFSIDSE